MYKTPKQINNRAGRSRYICIYITLVLLLASFVIETQRTSITSTWTFITKNSERTESRFSNDLYDFCSDAAFDAKLKLSIPNGLENPLLIQSDIHCPWTDATMVSNYMSLCAAIVFMFNLARILKSSQPVVTVVVGIISAISTLVSVILMSINTYNGYRRTWFLNYKYEQQTYSHEIFWMNILSTGLSLIMLIILIVIAIRDVGQIDDNTGFSNIALDKNMQNVSNMSLAGLKAMSREAEISNSNAEPNSGDELKQKTQ